VTDAGPNPPALTAPHVRAHRRALEARLVELRGTVPAAALAIVNKKFGAVGALAALRRKIANVEFEIAANSDAHDLAQAKDAAAHASWRKQVHELPIEQALEGIGRDSCCRRCRPNSPGGCVLGGGCDVAGTSCLHPVKEQDSFHNDDNGKKVFRLHFHERAAATFAAAATRLKVSHKFKERT
jgi:hypothetical protein